MKYAFILERQYEHSVRFLCHVLEVSPSAYYDWRKRPVSERKKKDDALQVLIKSSHELSRDSYGARRIKQDLESDGETVSRQRIRRLMSKNNLVSKHKKKFRITTTSDSKLPVADNLLNRNFKVAGPDQVYVGDITYVWTHEGWLYLAVMIDLFSRAVVGWSLSKRMKAALAINALEMAVLRRQPEAGLMVHHDRGSQYAGHDYQQLLERHGFVCSMSRKGNCWDNAVAESFFKTLKQELVNHCRFKTREEAEMMMFDYIEVFYNKERRHSNNEYLSPLEFGQLEIAA
jgi:putative transposase